MPIVPNEIKQIIEEPHLADPFHFLWELELSVTEPAVAPTWVRLVANRTPVSWQPPPRYRAENEAGPVTFYPFNMTQEAIEESGEGNLPSMRLTLSNVGRFVANALESFDIEANPARLWLVNKRLLTTSPMAYVEWKFEMDSATSTSDVVTFNMAMPNFLDYRLPVDRNAPICKYTQFGGRKCGYVINSAAAYTDCPRTLTACIDRGNDEVVRGLTRLHPMRYGGKPGISTQRIT